MLHPYKNWRHALAGAAGLLLALAVPRCFAAPLSTSVYLEDLTTSELQARIDGGSTTLLVPVGGTEQSGPHIALGKHNARAHALAGQIARRLGDAVVAPVVAYVPEGAIAPPAGHMRFAGTISIPAAAFEAMLDATARSLCQHGVRDVFFLGDHGGYQQNLQKAAARFAPSGRCRVHALPEYYRVSQTAYVAALKRRGFGDAEIGTHAGLADTALTLAVDPALVRPGLVGAARGAGVQGDPRRATAELGRVGTALIVDAAVAAIRAARAPQTATTLSIHSSR